MNDRLDEPDASQPRRVLVVSGVASWDYRFLVSLVNRSKDLIGDFYLLGDSGSLVEPLPAMDSQFAAYNAVILVDPPPPGAIADAPSEQWLALLDGYVRRRGGRLIYTAGPLYSPQLVRSKKAASLVSLLPVKPGAAPMDGKSRPPKTTARLTRAGRSHPLTQLIDPAVENGRLWEQVHSVSWSLPIKSAKENTQVLLESSNRNETSKAPLLAFHSVGAGNVVYIGFNGLWRLRQTPGIYQQFWRQSLLSTSIASKHSDEKK